MEQVSYALMWSLRLLCMNRDTEAHVHTVCMWLTHDSTLIQSFLPHCSFIHMVVVSFYVSKLSYVLR